jgi:glycosyltransferase involved in cell wall biosynthesis
MAPQSLTWALVIATYQRKHILPRCLKLAAKQTRPPQEIIVVDASPDWEDNRDLITEELAAFYRMNCLTYVKATRPSLTAQRNQGIALATADVLFLIDDDSLMYQNCAEEVMKIYEADVDGVVKGIQCINVPVPPDSEEIASQPIQTGNTAFQPQQISFRRFIKSLLGNEKTYFLPYDKVYPSHKIPAPLHALNIGEIQVMAGYAMTFRRNILLKEQFSEVLERYAAGEDQDLSYRVSRHGALLNAIDAHLCHLEISGGRLSSYTVSILAGLNMAVLQQFCSGDRSYTQRSWRKIIRRRILINFIKDLSERRWAIPRTRGNLFVLAQLKAIYSKSSDDLLSWYPSFQKQLIAADRVD